MYMYLDFGKDIWGDHNSRRLQNFDQCFFSWIWFASILPLIKYNHELKDKIGIIQGHDISQ